MFGVGVSPNQRGHRGVSCLESLGQLTSRATAFQGAQLIGPMQKLLVHLRRHWPQAQTDAMMLSDYQLIVVKNVGLCKDT